LGGWLSSTLFIGRSYLISYKISRLPIALKFGNGSGGGLISVRKSNVLFYDGEQLACSTLPCSALLHSALQSRWGVNERECFLRSGHFFLFFPSFPNVNLVHSVRACEGKEREERMLTIYIHPFAESHDEDPPLQNSVGINLLVVYLLIECNDTTREITFDN